MDWQSGPNSGKGTNVDSRKTWVLPATLNRCSHYLCCKAVKGAIRTSLLIAYSHQQFVTSPKLPYSHFLNGLICQKTLLVCQMTPLLNDKWRLHYCNSCCCLWKKDGWNVFTSLQSLEWQTRFYIECNSGFVLEKLGLSKLLSGRFSLPCVYRSWSLHDIILLFQSNFKRQQWLQQNHKRLGHICSGRDVFTGMLANRQINVLRETLIVKSCTQNIKQHKKKLSCGRP